MKDLSRYIADAKDFPKKGIIFKDISPLLKDHFQETISSFAALFDKEILGKTKYIAGIDSRGFIFASALAQYLNKGFVMIRKEGKLPPPVISENYSLEYGKNTIEIAPGEGGVIIVDDVLATGGTLKAAANLCEKAGYDVLDIATLIDIKHLNDFEWNGLRAKSLIQYGKDDILIAMALKDECRGYFSFENVVYTGLGKVNAAYALTEAIKKKKPKLVVNLGSAGSAVFNKGELINCTGFVQRDMDVSGLGYEKFVTPFEGDDSQILQYGEVIPELKQGICGTGDSFDTSSNSQAIYNVVDMESYSLAKICKSQGIPFLCVKYITDGADGNAGGDWNNALEAAAKKLFLCYENHISQKPEPAKEAKPKIHLCLFNIFHINYVIDQVEFMLATFKQNGYEISVGNEFKDDALNVLIECFDEYKQKKPSDVEKIINYCEKNNKKIAVIMTEHIDYFDRKIYAYSAPIDDIDSSHYNPVIKRRMLSLLTLSPYIKHIFTLGEFPKLYNFQQLMGKTPIRIPYPKISSVVSRQESEYDFVFSGKATKYRLQIMEDIKEKEFSLHNNAYQNILTRRKRNCFISKAKINLNVPQDEQWQYPSTLRIILALSLGKLTISIENSKVEHEFAEEDFYIKINPDNLGSMEKYLARCESYYAKCLDAYNKLASKMEFPDNYFKLWSITELKK